MKESMENKRVLVVGLARSGLAAAEMLLQLGARPVLSDTKPQIPGVEALIQRGCESRIGRASCRERV